VNDAFDADTLRQRLPIMQIVDVDSLAHLYPMITLPAEDRALSPPPGIGGLTSRGAWVS
jgi:hypothetical protein